MHSYQIVDKGDGSATSLSRRIDRVAEAVSAAGTGGEGQDPLSLVEMMVPRLVLDPIRVFAGSLGGEHAVLQRFLRVAERRSVGQEEEGGVKVRGQIKRLRTS